MDTLFQKDCIYCKGEQGEEVKVMGINYYESRVDTFLPSVSVKPKDNREYGYTQRDIKEKRQKLIAAAREKEKFRRT